MRNNRIIIALALVVCVMMALTACVFEQEHTHAFSSDWTNDADSHWHVCTGEDCAEISDKAAHSYDEGTVTTPATEEAEGAITYVCVDCGYEKVEAIEKLEHVHAWDSEWSNDETNHWHASACGHEDKDVAPHSFDDGFVDKAPTEEETGVMVYTCIDCGYEYEEEIPTTGHTHKYEDTWTSDENAHWHAASCGHGVIRDKETHTYGDGVVTLEPTEEAEGVTSYYCTTCNYEKKVAIDKLPHTHKFADSWSSDADNHWYGSTCEHPETETKFPHEFDEGVVTLEPTEDAEGVKTFTCTTCGYKKEQAIASLTHTHQIATEYSSDANYHWFAALCGHDDIVVKALHSYDENGNCVCGAHKVCPTCANCVTPGCTACETKCHFIDTNSIVTYVPNAGVLAAPEGPDGLAPGKAGAYIYDQYIKAEFVTLEDGANAVLISVPYGTAAHSGVSFGSNKQYDDPGKAGFNVIFPQAPDKTELMRLHFTNPGTSEITFKFSMIDYYYDKGAVTLTLAPGESKTVVMESYFENGTIGLNSQIVFPEGAAEGAAVTVWGEFVAENISDLAVKVPANETVFSIGDTFSAEGLALGAKGIAAKKSYTDIYQRAYITSNFVTNLDGYTFTADDLGTHTVTVTFAGLTTTYTIEVVPVTAEDCAAGNHYGVASNSFDNYYSGFAGFEGSDAMYNKVCALCGTKLEETFAADKILFVPHYNIGGGHKIEYVTLEDGRIAAKLTFNSDVLAGTSFTITASNYPAGINVAFPVFGEGRYVYMDMLSSADIKLTWQPEFYSDRDGITLDLVADVMNGGGRLIKYDYNASHTEEDCPYQEIVAESDIKAGTVVYLTGYFYTMGEISGVTVKTPVNQISFQVGDTFSSAGLTFKPVAANKWFADTIIHNYTTDLDGYVFTDSDVGTKTVTVSVAGVTYTYEISITHIHSLELVEAQDAVKCESDGYQAYYKCTFDGCDDIFADADGVKKLDAPVVIPCHNAPAVAGLPCIDCGAQSGNADGWVLFTLTTQINTTGSDLQNFKLEHADVNGFAGTNIYIGAGSKGGTGNNGAHIKMSDNDSGYQTVIPSRGTGAPANRKIVMYYVNYGDEDVVLNLQNDNKGGNGSVTIPAHGSAYVEFENKNSGGSNWYWLYLDSDVNSDTVIGAYGFFCVYNEEIDPISINTPATKTEFKVGETYENDGLVVNVPIKSSKTVYAQTGYTTDLDGYTFTADDIGTKTVTVTFAGKTVTYEITVTE